MLVYSIDERLCWQKIQHVRHMSCPVHFSQGFEKERNFVLDNVTLFFMEIQPAKRHGESTPTASQLSHKISKVPHLLQNLYFTQGFVKGEVLCFRYPYFYFWLWDSSSTASQLSKDLNKVPLLYKTFTLPHAEAFYPM